MICAATRQEHCFSDEYTLFNARQMLSTAPRLPCLLGQQLSQHLLRGLSGQGYESHTDTDLTGHTYCVTGSTSGIGNTTALLLAQQGATVLVHGRYVPTLVLPHAEHFSRADSQVFSLC